MSNSKLRKAFSDEKSASRSIAIFLVALALSFAAVLLLRRFGAENTEIPTFIYDSTTGICAIFNFAFLAAMVIVNVVSPSGVLFNGMRNNRWYYLLRLGASAASIADCVIRKRLFSPLIAFVAGQAVVIGSCMLLGVRFYINGLISIIGFGLLSVVLTLSVFNFIGVSCKRKASASILVLIYAVLFGFAAWAMGLFGLGTRRTFAMSYANQMRLSGITSLVVFAVLIIVFLSAYFLAARDRCAFYRPAEIKKTLLVKMGITKNVRVHEGEKLITEGSASATKREQRRMETTALNLNTEKSETAHAARSRNARAPQEGAEHKKGRTGKVVLSIIGALLLGAIAVGGGLVRAVSPDTAVSLLGYTAVQADEAVRTASVGDVLIFNGDSVAAGDIALYSIGRSFDYSTVSEQSGSMYIMANGDNVGSGEVMGKYYGSIAAINFLHENLEGVAGIVIIAAFGAAAVAVFVFGVFVKKKEAKPMAAAVEE